MGQLLRHCGLGRGRLDWIAVCGADADCANAAKEFSRSRRGVWQPRFIEHTIRDEQDLLQHADYIHYNPVKHGYAKSPKDWPWSSFRRYVISGDYPENWSADNRLLLDFSKVGADLLE